MSDEEQTELFNTNGEGIKGMVPSHPHDTEVEAAVEIAKLKSRLQAEVLQAFRECGPMTDEELEELPRFRHYGPTTVSKRRTELYQKGLLEYAGFKRPNHRGFNMKVWRIPDE